MKNLKRFGALLLTLVLSLSLAVPAFAAERFSDVPDSASYAEAVNWAAEQGYVNGYNDGRFGIHDNVARQQLAAILYRAAGSPAASGTTRFSDVAAGAYYVDAASWAADNGLINGYQDGRFGVGDNVTRQQVIAILWRWAGSPDASAEDYTDDGAISGYAQTAVDWSRANNIMAGREDGRFDPAAPAARVEIVSALYQYMNRSSGGETPAVSETPDTSSAGGRVLVAYFSATNNTEAIANHLDAILDADLYEIVPEQPYTSADLNYNHADCRANQEQNDPNARPAVSGSVDNMEQYDVIFLGYPIWWGQAPKIIYTFLESYDLSGKTIVPFCTSGSSGIGSSAANLHTLAGSATWLYGQRFSGGASRSAVETWVNGLGLALTPAA
nr:flavodoxin [uncultured Oscillibacter sp.]